MLRSIKSNLILMLLTTALICVGASWGYYSFVLHLIHSKEEVYVQNAITQIISNIQTSAEDMNRFAKMISNSSATQDFLVSDLPLDRLESAGDLSDSLFSITQDTQGMSVMILTADGVLGFASRPSLSLLEQMERQYHIDTLSSDESGFTGLVRNTYEGFNYFAYYTPILDIKYNILPQRKIGTCVILMPIRNLQSCIDQAETTPHSLFFIMDRDQEIIVSNQNNADESSEALLRAVREGTLGNGSIQTINGDDHMIFYEKVDTTGWQVVGAVPLHEINSDLTGILIFGVVTLLLLGILFLTWGVHIFRSVALPVVEISKYLQGDAYSRLHTPLVLKTKNEIGVLAGHINQMLDKISDMTRTILTNQSNMYELDLAKKRAELSALQSQINPHFLYNTLDCIKGYGYLLNSGEIVQIVDALSQIMRYCIKGADIVPLDAEIHIIEQYLSIIQVRFDGRFDTKVEIPAEIRRAQIPRFILQPLVENAVYHGLEPKYGPGSLQITGILESSGDIEIRVTDDGAGMDRELAEQINERLKNASSQSLFDIESKKGLALLNINQRIRQIFGMQYGLTVESSPGAGTTVRLRFPFRE